MLFNLVDLCSTVPLEKQSDQRQCVSGHAKERVPGRRIALGLDWAEKEEHGRKVLRRPGLSCAQLRFVLSSMHPFSTLGSQESCRDLWWIPGTSGRAQNGA